MTHSNTLDLLQEVFVHITDQDLSEALEQIIEDLDSAPEYFEEVLRSIMDSDLPANLAEQVEALLEDLDSKPARKRRGVQPLRIW